MEILKKIMNKKMFIILLMGISSGLPLALTGGTLQAWMKDSGSSLTSIGIFALVGLPYTFKFLWAPLMDRFTLNKMGRRRSWMLIIQLLLILSIFGIASSNPQDNLWMVAFWSVLIAFFSASQDIVIDAWRRESLSNEELGFGSSVHVNGYLFAFRLISGALALILADYLSWNIVYSLMTLGIFLGVIATLLCDEPDIHDVQPRTLRESVVNPFLDYFKRPGAIIILVFIILYKLGDNMALQMTTPFYMDLGFTKTEIGAISKSVGWISLAIGSLFGGGLMIRLKILPSLIVFGILQAIAVFGFAILSQVGANISALTIVISFENFVVGMGTTAFTAFMASITNRRFTATQYALLTSFMAIPRTILVAPTGWMAEQMGWFSFFSLCSLVAIPGILMVFWMKRFQAAS